MIARQCTVNGCETIGKIVKGMCNKHYLRFKNHNTTELLERPVRSCSVKGCKNSFWANGFCNTHYARHRYNTKENLRVKQPEYKSWLAMKQRCLNPNHMAYKRYGDRGITVYKEWIDSFDAFYEYMGKRPDRSYSLDRIDNDGNYEPGNVRWANRSVQSINRQSVKSKSGIRGVYYVQSRNKWLAAIRTNGVKLNKWFNSKEDAVNWRKMCEDKYHKPILEGKVL